MNQNATKPQLWEEIKRIRQEVIFLREHLSDVYRHHSLDLVEMKLLDDIRANYAPLEANNKFFKLLESKKDWKFPYSGTDYNKYKK